MKSTSVRPPPCFISETTQWLSHFVLERSHYKLCGELNVGSGRSDIAPTLREGEMEYLRNSLRGAGQSLKSRHSAFQRTSWFLYVTRRFITVFTKTRLRTLS
jgi:hypothetical protein